MKCELCQLNINNSWQLRDFCDFSVYKPTFICKMCYDNFQQIDPEKACLECQITTEQKYCIDCQRWFRLGYPKIHNQSLFKYDTQMKQYFKAYKFEGGYHLRNVFKQVMQQRLIKVQADMIVPIPITNDTFTKRQFNQVIGWLDGMTFEELLICREVKKDKQSQKTRDERLCTKQPFVLRQPGINLVNQRICLVDDIYTTGRTLRHAAHCLMAAGALEVTSLTLAR